jgi:hypothetical protein
LDDMHGRSDEPRGDTPVVRLGHLQENLCMSAVTNRGTVRWVILAWAMNPALLIAFMRRLARCAAQGVSDPGQFAGTSCAAGCGLAQRSSGPEFDKPMPDQ